MNSFALLLLATAAATVAAAFPLSPYQYYLTAAAPARVAYPFHQARSARAPVGVNYFAPSVARDFASCTPAPLAINCSYSVDDTSNTYACSSPTAISSATIGEIATIDVATGALCSDYLFEITNVAYSAGMSMACTAGDTTYSMWGQGAPRNSGNYYQWEIYASWEHSCYKYEERPGPQVNYAPSLLNQNQAMAQMVADFDAYPFSAAGPNYTGGNTMCILVKNLVCK